MGIKFYVELRNLGVVGGYYIEMSLIGLLSRSVRCTRWVGCISIRVSKCVVIDSVTLALSHNWTR